MNKNRHALACDIGGTKTNLVIVSESSGPLYPVLEKTVKSSDYPNATALIKEFLSMGNISPEVACVGVAGPVLDNQSSTTNLPWHLDGEEISKTLCIDKVTLVNDLQATAASITLLKDKDLLQLNKGRQTHKGNIAVISPGTGLGQGFLTWDAAVSAYASHASEGGHADFAPSNDIEVRLLEYLKKKLGHVSFESVCSGRGLPNIFEFLKESRLQTQPEWLSNLMETADDPGKVIIETALDKDNSSPICHEAVNMFVAILGSEAGNLALKLMATGGVYIGGGIPARIAEILDPKIFLKGFLNKGRMSDLLTDIQVNVILDHKAPLKGAAQIALNNI